MIHRDIKPDNVLLSGGTAVVTDFGIAKAVELAKTAGDATRKGALTGTGMSIGTPAYMAPEQIAGDGTTDHRADIYSLGTLAYELLTGHPPFHDRTPQRMIAAQIMDAPSPMSSVQPQLNALVLRCLAKDPGARPQSADEVLKELESLTASRSRSFASLRTTGVALVALIAAGVVYANSRKTDTIVLGATVQVTSTPELEVDAAISPDGKLIAYVAEVGPELRVMTRPATSQAGDRSTIVAPNVRGAQRSPHWSKDGTTLLFASGSEVYEAPALGGAAHLLFDAGRDIIRPNPTPVYSPDGKAVLYNTAEGIKLVNVAGGEPRMIIKGAELHSAQWSPDGTRIAYVVGNRQWVNATGTLAPSAVWVSRVDKPAPVQVSDASHINVSPVWLTDDVLLFISSAGGMRDVYQVDANGKGAPTRITTGLEPFSISYSRDAHRLAYSVLRSRFNIWGGAIRAVGETPLSELTEITHDNQRVEGISLSPDGRTLAFDANRHGNNDIFRVPAEGGEVTQLTRDSTDEYQPEWSRDGKHIAFYATKNGTRDVFVMDADGRNVETVASTKEEERAPTWSPDGNRVAFIAGGKGMTGQNVFISERQANGTWSAARQITTKGAVFPRWSPDGKWISYARNGDEVIVSPLDGTERVVAEKGPDGIAFFAVWSSDASTLYVARVQLGRSIWSYWRVPLAGGPEQVVLRTGTRRARSANATFATDGKRIYVTLGGDEGDVWTVDVKKP